MEKNINLAKILNGKPVNTKLWSPLFGDVYTSSICSEDTIIVVNHHAKSSSFYNNGKYFDHAEAEPLLFPSKEMRDWSKFAWKKGDVLKNTAYDGSVIFDGFLNDDYTYFKGKHPLDCSDKFDITYHEECNCFTGNYRLESTDAAQTYINTIEERLGGKLNRETLEIEPAQPAFKDGDIVVYGESVAICRRVYKHTLSFYVSLNEMFGLLFADEVESSEEYRFATEEEKQQLFDALEKEGKAWDAEKKQIVDIKKEHQFKPFEKVLVRDSIDDVWRASFFSHIKENDGRYVTTCVTWKFCIPYIGNESLVGTTKDVEG